jgi:mRNA interferase RelE/StbE
LAWRVEVTPAAAREWRKLDRQAAQRIGAYLQEVVTSCSHPRERGTSLTANRVGLWRYRVGDYRVIFELEDERLLVLVVRVAHRSEAYR